MDPIAFGGGGIHCSTQQQPVGITAETTTTTTRTVPDGSTSDWALSVRVGLYNRGIYLRGI